MLRKDRCNPGPDKAASTGGAGPCLRVLIVTADDPLYVSCFFETLIPALPDAVRVVAVTVLPAFHESRYLTVRRVLRLYGWVDFARLFPRYAWARVRGRSAARQTRKSGMARLDTRSVNSEDYLRRVAVLAPDVIVSVAAPEIFKAALLSIPRLGCLNVHSGALPSYRGMMPVFWQLLAGESTAVVTVHQMVERVDAGRILGIAKVPLRKHDRLARAMVAAKRAGAHLLVDVLDRLRHGPATFERKQGDNRYRGFPRPEDVCAFRSRGHSML